MQSSRFGIIHANACLQQLPNRRASLVSVRNGQVPFCSMMAFLTCPSMKNSKPFLHDGHEFRSAVLRATTSKHRREYQKARRRPAFDFVWVGAHPGTFQPSHDYPVSESGALFPNSFRTRSVCLTYRFPEMSLPCLI